MASSADLNELISQGLPPVHPLLVDHLREKFPRSLGKTIDPNEAFADLWEQVGAERVIDYLVSLLPQAAEQENEHELLEAQDEHPGPDPRSTSPGRGR